MATVAKKLVNDTYTAVDDALKGLTLVYPGLRLHADIRLITQTNEECTLKIGLLSGGGSGHEPFCAGYVGKGMLAGAVAGSVFASPPKNHIIKALRYLNHFYKGGLLVVIPNYTGDCLNFGMAVEQAKSEGLNVETIVVGEDCASGFNSIAGRRGMCGLLFVYKIGGALAERGESLQHIMETLTHVILNMATLGISLQPCSLPGQPPLFNMAPDEMELGTGVHGEAGIEKLKMTSAKEAVRIVLERLINCLHITGAGTKVAVLINNLGTTTQLEQSIVAGETYSQLAILGITVERMYSGMLMTSLDMAGFQICILRLPAQVKDAWLSLLDQTTDAHGWVGSIMSIPNPERNWKIVDYNVTSENIKSKYSLSKLQKILMKQCLISASDEIIKNETKLNELDGGCGDGDCGTTLKRLAEGILEALPAIMNHDCPAQILQLISHIAETNMGGTSGAIYSLCFSSMRKYFLENAPSSDDIILPLVWSQACLAGIEVIMKYGQASVGDRTIVDAMKPAIDKFHELVILENSDVKNALKETLDAAKIGCEETKSMKARAGRASYVNVEHLTEVDAGAFGFVCWLEAIVNTIVFEML